MTARVVETSSGRIEGRAGAGFQSFLGIPYAAPPTGAGRFRPPEPAPAWTGVRAADAFGPVAPQLPSPLENLLGAAPIVSDEAGCLSLNVWTPDTGGGGRPVMVWIHGGAFITGSGSTPWYDGAHFAVNHDVVVVTVNYRLGVLGFTYLAELAGPDYQASGSVGILDQAAALGWVRDNIAAFGGDPGNVTIFGESAGAMCVGTLLGLPEASGLFHRAILQSGAASNSLEPDKANQYATELLAALDLGPGDVARLQQLPVEALLEAQGKLALAYAQRGMMFQPVVDGSVLERRPIDSVAAGSVADVPILIGTNRDEWNLFSVMDPRFASTDEAALEAAAAALFGEGAGAAVSTYRAGRPGATPAQILSAMTTDSVFRIPAVRLAEAQQKAGGDAWMYRFDWATSAFGGLLGSCHALEIPFVFDNLHQPGASVFVGDQPPGDLASAMNAAWAAFARHGRPGGDLGDWAPYEAGTRATMVLDESIGVREDPMGEERALWEGLR
ncbi:MAG TPA: carboxylesterase/lipase family protein [Acidimicrobiales bacterium]|nr:carboxylesterase/lipase family protein [Acidimicrobiales bacterium]